MFKFLLIGKKQPAMFIEKIKLHFGVFQFPPLLDVDWIRV